MTGPGWDLFRRAAPAGAATTGTALVRALDRVNLCSVPVSRLSTVAQLTHSSRLV
jgi:hypothetical protein